MKNAIVWILVILWSPFTLFGYVALGLMFGIAEWIGSTYESLKDPKNTKIAKRLWR